MRSLKNSSAGFVLSAALALTTYLAAPVNAQDDGRGGPGFDGPPPFGQGGPGPGGFGGMMRQKIELVKKYDKNGDGWLNATERKAARESLSQNPGGQGPMGRRGMWGGFGQNQEKPQPGPKIAPSDIKTYPSTVALYDGKSLRTFFLEFENADWEQELAAFKNTDVEVPAKLTVDGKVYPDVGVRFRGNTSYMMVSEGHKRSLSLTLDFIHKDQNIGGYRTLHLMNSHEDPTFMRIVLFCDIARDYIPAPKANFVRVAINGESWGIYVNEQSFNKDFEKEWFDTKKGARWKVPGNPGGQGGMSYLGENAEPYKKIYEIKSKDDPKSWASLIQLCKVLNQTPVDKLEQALAPLLDIDGALKFFALDNTLANNDGFWTRASDYGLCQDNKGRFHIVPLDVNETFSSGSGPGGPAGFGGPGGPGGAGGFGPGMFLAPQMLTQADRNADHKITADEWNALAASWSQKLDPDNTGQINLDQFTAKWSEITGMPTGQPGGNGPGGNRQSFGSGRGGFDPSRMVASGMFKALDEDKNDTLTQAEIQITFKKWFATWDKEKSGSLNEENLRAGLNGVLPQPSFAAAGAGRGGRRGPGGGGFGGMRMASAELDPLVDANDNTKPILSKLLAIPAFRNRYLGYVKDIANKWLDWNKLGPLTEQYQSLISADVKADTRKLDSFEDFVQGISGEVQNTGGFGPGRKPVSLKNFAEKRRNYLLNYSENKQVKNP